MIENLSPEILNPPAIVQAAFDEQRALAEIRTAIEQRDEAKGEYKDAILVIGQRLIEARRAMPGTKWKNRELYSPAFLAFIKETGLIVQTASAYMMFARDPKKLETHRANKNNQGRTRQARLARNVIAAFEQGIPFETVVADLREEFKL